MAHRMKATATNNSSNYGIIKMYVYLFIVGFLDAQNGLWKSNSKLTVPVGSRE